MNIKIIPDKIILFFSFIYFVALDLAGIILPGGPGRYVLLIALFGIVAGYCIKKNSIISIKANRYSAYLLIFALFTLLSSLWAINPVIAQYWGKDLIGVFFMMTIIYICCKEVKTIDSLLMVLMFGGYSISISAIIYYGIEMILFLLSNSLRISNEFMNANILGLVTAFSIVIHFYFWIYQKAKLWWLFLAIPGFLVLLTSSSRKALVVVLLGSFMLLILKNLDNKDKVKGLLKMLGAVLLMIVLIIILVKRFSDMNIYTRMMGLINGFLGNENADNSTIVRFQLIELGKDIFKKNPLIGIGMDNAKIIVLNKIGREDFYLHNNYIEMLADGGIVGFVIYYWIYVVLIYQMIKYRNFRNPEYNICMILLVLWMLMDYGMVSYLSKRTYFYLMIICIAADRFKRDYQSGVLYQ